MNVDRYMPDWIRSRTTGISVTILAVVCGVAGALLAFAKLVDEIAEGDTRRFDTAIMLALRNPEDPATPIGPLWLQIMFRDLTSLGSHAVITFVTLAALGFLWINRKRVLLVLLLLAVGGGALLSTALKHAFGRPRPDLVAHSVDVYSLSFPSGHALLSAITYLTLAALVARAEEGRSMKIYVMSVAAAIVLLVGFSRVYLGVHWPTDVLAGWCLGAAWAMAAWLLATWLDPQRNAHHDEGQGGRATAGLDRNDRHENSADRR